MSNILNRFYDRMNKTSSEAKTVWTDKMSGGKADFSVPSDYKEEDLEEGVDVEMEHTDDKGVAKEIAMDHLEEFDNYYEELDEMETRMKKEKLMRSVKKASKNEIVKGEVDEGALKSLDPKDQSEVKAKGVGDIKLTSDMFS